MPWLTTFVNVKESERVPGVMNGASEPPNGPIMGPELKTEPVAGAPIVPVNVLVVNAPDNKRLLAGS